VSLRDAIERDDRPAFRELLDPRVAWVGVFPTQLCRDRREVLAMPDQPTNDGRRLAPAILAERDGKLALALHPDPPPEWAPDLHMVFVEREGRVVEMRDYASAVEAVAAVEADW
jgi:ketosteroid isomerase-like protein